MSLDNATKSFKARSPQEIRTELKKHGISITCWAKRRGFSPGLVYQVLAGRLKCKHGDAHRVAVALGLKEGVISTVDDLPF
jgi:gp16 family phage-associated protein